MHLGDHVRHAIRLRLDRASDGGLSRPDAGRVRESNVVAEDGSELNDPEEQQEHEREHERELDDRLPTFTSRVSSHVVGYRHFS